ncbi:MAG: MarR family transcriptional regulator [Paraburkholderia fungorum]|nr:MarR family transcriptional regulator [Paraburkholderia fungorum]
MDKGYDNRLGFLITDAGRLCGRLFDERAKASLGLTRAQSRVLAYLSWYGETNQARLAETLEISPISLTRLLDRMAKGGWVIRAADASDRRAYCVKTTRKARTALVQVLDVGDRIADEALAGLNTHEREMLMGLLHRMRANLAHALASCGTTEV